MFATCLYSPKWRRFLCSTTEQILIFAHIWIVKWIVKKKNKKKADPQPSAVESGLPTSGGVQVWLCDWMWGVSACVLSQTPSGWINKTKKKERKESDVEMSPCDSAKTHVWPPNLHSLVHFSSVHTHIMLSLTPNPSARSDSACLLHHQDYFPRLVSCFFIVSLHPASSLHALWWMFLLLYETLL